MVNRLTPRACILRPRAAQPVPPAGSGWGSDRGGDERGADEGGGREPGGDGAPEGIKDANESRTAGPTR